MSLESTSQSPDKSFKGSCHCGKIRYELLLPHTDTPKAMRCNCTMCQKPGYLILSVPPTNFTLISPSSKSELSDYTFRSTDCHRYFCEKCGVQVYSEGEYEAGGHKVSFFTVNINTLDQPQKGLDLSEFKIEYFDMLHDNWQAGVKDSPYPGGSR